MDQSAELLDILTKKGASSDQITKLRNALAHVSVSTNYGVVASQISGPVAVGRSAKAIQEAPKSTQAAASEKPAAKPAPGKSFWEKAKSIAATAASASEAVEHIMGMVTGSS